MPFSASVATFNGSLRSQRVLDDFHSARSAEEWAPRMIERNVVGELQEQSGRPR